MGSSRLRKNSSGVRSSPPAAGSRFDFAELTARVELVPFPKSAGDRVFPQPAKSAAADRGVRPTLGRQLQLWLRWGFLGGSVGQHLLDESWWHGCGDNRAISALLDFQAVEECFYIGVGAVGANAAFGGVKQVEEGRGLLGDRAGGILAAGEGFGA